MLCRCRAECVDLDGDGYGTHCARGTDCDDRNGALALTCSAAVDCQLRPTEPACRCADGAERSCYSGPLDTQQQGLCRTGTQRCDDETWGPCEGERLPALERCNDEDDDCDGLSDEGVHSPCGPCDSECVGEVWGDGAAPFSPSSPLTTLPDGALTLDPAPVETMCVWVGNSDEWTVSQIDAERRRELARHRLMGSPQRLAVDFAADAYALSTDATLWRLTKLPAWNDCQASDGPNAEDLASPPARWSIEVAEATSAQAALAIDGSRDADRELAGHPWVAVLGAVLQFHGEDGTAIKRIDIPGLEPQDAVFDLQEQLWISDRSGILWQVAAPHSDRPTVTRHVVPLSCFRLDAIAARSDDTLLVSTAECESVLHYLPERDRFATATTTGLLSARGLVTTTDGDYVVHPEGALSQVDLQELLVGPPLSLLGPVGRPLQTIAVGATTDGALWVPSHHSRDGVLGLASRLDSTLGLVTDQVQVGYGPAALGDLTGQRLLGSMPEMGVIERRFNGCGSASQTLFEAIHLDMVAPTGSYVEVAFRVASSEAELTDEPYLAAQTLTETGSFSLGPLLASKLELKLALHSGGHHAAPRVRRVGVEWSCAGPD